MNDNGYDDATNGPTPPDRASHDPNGHIDPELLAAFADEPEIIDQTERARIDEHLAACRECQRTLAELETVVQTLRSLAPADAPQTFYLTPEMVGHQQRPVELAAPEPWYLRHVDKVRWAAAAAAVLFVVVLTADLAVNGLGPTTTDEEGALDSSQSIEQAPASGASDSAADAPAAEMQEEASGGGESAAGATSESKTPDASIMGMDPTEAAQARPPTAAENLEEAATATPQTAAGRDDAQAATPADEALRQDGDDGTGATVEQMPPEVEEDDRESNSRQYWRLAEFSLVVLLIGLTATMVILSRMRRGPR